MKVVVVGDSGVGKSSILFRFVNDEFNEFSEATLGAAFVSKVHNYGDAKAVQLQVLQCKERCGIRPARRSTSRLLPSTTSVPLSLLRVTNCTHCIRHN